MRSSGEPGSPQSEVSQIKGKHHCVSVTMYAFTCAKLLLSCLTLQPHGQQPSRLLWQGFSRQEYWSELPRPPPGDFPDQGLNQHLLHLLHCRQILIAQPPEKRFYYTIVSLTKTKQTGIPQVFPYTQGCEILEVYRSILSLLPLLNEITMQYYNEQIPDGGFWHSGKIKSHKGL